MVWCSHWHFNALQYASTLSHWYSGLCWCLCFSASSRLRWYSQVTGQSGCMVCIQHYIGTGFSMFSWVQEFMQPHIGALERWHIVKIMCYLVVSFQFLHIFHVITPQLKQSISEHYLHFQACVTSWLVVSVFNRLVLSDSASSWCYEWRSWCTQPRFYSSLMFTSLTGYHTVEMVSHSGFHDVFPRGCESSWDS